MASLALKNSTPLKTQVVTGLSWSALSQIVTQLLTFAVSIVVARLLGPKAYGLVGMVTVFTDLAALLGDLGLGPTIIQRTNLDATHLNAAFSLNLLVGALLTVSSACSAPWIASFYHEPQLLSLTLVLSLRYMLGSLTVVQTAVLRRTLAFKRLGKIQMASTLLAGLVGMSLAFSGCGVWSLIAQTIVSSLTLTVSLWWLSPWQPTLRFSWVSCKELFSFSGYVLGFNIVNYGGRSLDQLLIGRFVGPLALGIYSRAYSLMLAPLNQVSRTVGNVMFPALSAIQHDKSAVKRIYLKAIGVISLITFPMMTGLFVLTDDLIPSLLGTRWAPAIPIVKLFCWVGLIQSIGSTTGWIFLSQGRSRALIYEAISSGIIMAAFVVGIRWGVRGVAWSYMLCNLVEWLPLWAITGRIVRCRLREMLRTLMPTFLCAVAMAICVKALEGLLSAALIPLERLGIEITFGIVVYALLMIGFQPTPWREFWQTFGATSARRLLAGASGAHKSERLSTVA